MILAAERIVTGDGKTVLKDQGIVLDKTGKIRQIRPLAQLKSSGEEIREYKGCTILPGLIDLHVHISAWGDKPFGYGGSDFVHAYITLRNARRAYRTGVTCIRSVADKNGLVAGLVWADQNQILDEPIPRLIPCGNGICMTGGHGSEFPDGGDIADGPWEVRKRIRKNLQDGAQWIKLLTSRREFIPEFTQEELDAAVDECHRRNRKIAVHSGVPITIQMCIDANVDTIEHGTFLSEDQARQMIEKSIAWVPTAMVYSENAKTNEVYAASQKAYEENIKKYFDMGILMGAGTDVPVDIYGVNTYLELEYLVQYGLTPLEAIQVGTQNGARILDMAERIGTVGEGMEGDLLVVDGDPSRDIKALRNVKAVFQYGKAVYER